MEGKIVAFWAFVYLLLLFLKLRPGSTLARAALAWFGPLPVAEQSWASFQFRWAIYSFGWLCQIALVFSVLFFVAAYYPRASGSIWFQVFAFALPLGAGVAALASIGFLFKAVKARYFGPNPVCTLAPDTPEA